MGRENIPQNGPIVLASNHFGYFDPFLLVHGIRKPIDFIMQKELGIEPHFLFAPMIYGAIMIDRNKVGPSTIKESLKSIKNGKILGIFPEGDTESDQLRAPKAGVVYLSASQKTPIVPLGVYGLKKSLWYYLFRGVRPHIEIKIGKPFGPYTLSKDKINRENELIEIGNIAMCRIAALLPKTTHGMYSNDPKVEQYKKDNEN